MARAAQALEARQWGTASLSVSGCACSLRSRSASAFGAYYRALEARGLRGYRALMAVMRKMLVVAYHLLKSGEQYDPTKVWSGGAVATTS